MRPLLLITGVAEGLGASTARTFALAGHDVLGVARSDTSAAGIARQVGEAGGAYIHIACDITQPAALAEALEPYADRVAVFVHNAQSLLIKSFRETSTDDFEHVWRVTCFGAFTAAQIVLPRMAARASGTVLLTGATAARRGAGKFSAFASAKFALRGLAQSLSREFGPQGVHVAHVVIDGLIDTAATERRFGPAQATRMDPDAIARLYLHLATQEATAWTHKLDVRPSSERY